MWYSLIEEIRAEADEIHARLTTDGQSPWFAGHFPDNPILPGIAQLKMVADCIVASRKGDVRLSALSRVKFKKIVRPGDVLDIHATISNKKDQYAFRISSNSEDVCSGMMLFSPIDTI